MNENEKKLLDVAGKGQVAEAKELINQGADINCQDEKGRSPLMIATQNNDLEMAQLLIDEGANVNLRDNMLLTPWICAAANGFYEILKAGVKHAEVTLVNRFGGTALLPSSEKGFLKAASVALESGVPVNHINDLGWSALQEAVILGDGKSLYSLITRMLMDHGADPTTLDHDNKTALDWAKEYDQPYILALLNKEVDRTSPNELLIDDILADIEADRFTEAEKKAADGIKEYQDKVFYFLKGYSLVLQKNYGAAIEAYEEGAEHAKGDPEFYFYIADAYREMKQPEDAIATFQKGIDHDPEHFYFRYHLSNYLRELGRHEDAIAQMDTLLEQEPHRYDYAFHKANSLRVLGKNQEADEVLNLQSDKS